ncbi:MAG: hypothetical protein WAU91_15630 [Desulfatitalea sp.]
MDIDAVIVFCMNSGSQLHCDEESTGSFKGRKISGGTRVTPGVPVRTMAAGANTTDYREKKGRF